MAEEDLVHLHGNITSELTSSSQWAMEFALSVLNLKYKIPPNIRCEITFSNNPFPKAQREYVRGLKFCMVGPLGG